MTRSKYQVGVKKLTTEIAATVKGMCLRGDRQMDVALYLGLSPSTVNQIKLNKVKPFKDVEPAPLHSLPPPGPYVIVNAEQHVIASERAALAEEVLRDLDKLGEKYRRVSASIIGIGKARDEHAREATGTS